MKKIGKREKRPIENCLFAQKKNKYSKPKAESAEVENNVCHNEIADNMSLIRDKRTSFRTLGKKGL